MVLGRVGIRRETKDSTQRRAPLSPSHVRSLVRDHGLELVVQPWDNRVFPDHAYREAGATLSDDLSSCNIVFGVKEVFPEYQIPKLAHVFFSHTAKGQEYNMPMLQHLMQIEGTLFDYEGVTDSNGKRLIFFGDYAGYAGMIDSLWALGRRLAWEGIPNPFTQVQYATQYEHLDSVRTLLRSIGNEIRSKGLDRRLVPFICGFTGYGQVSRAAQNLYDELPVKSIRAEQLASFVETKDFSDRCLYKVEFQKPDLYRPRDGSPFDVNTFSQHPELFEGCFERHLPHLTMVINGIYWEPRFPRLITKKGIAALYRSVPNPRLRVIGDITCDIDGSVELTVKATTEQNPVFVYDPIREDIHDGWEGNGPVVLAVDKLPAELPLEASESFGAALAPYVPDLARADFMKPFDELAVPADWLKAMIVHRGQLTPAYHYLQEHIAQLK